MDSIICETTSSINNHYAPPLLGNGDLSIQLDCEGAQRQVAYCQMLPGIYRAGHRYFNPGYPLVHFGYLTQTLDGTEEPPVEWTQSLDVTHGIMRSKCRYASGVVIENEAFCPFGRPVLYIRKRVCSAGGKALPEIRLTYTLPSHRMNIVEASGNSLCYDIDGLENYRGRITLLSSTGNVSSEANCLMATASDTQNDFCLSFEETPSAISYDEALAAHIADWDAYWDEGSIDVPSASIMRLYYTAQYHLRVTSTNWGLPTGIFPSHWQGRYFGFDELFAFRALLGSGHFGLAKKIPDFRFRTLPFAIGRSSDSMNRANPNDKSAHYSWESLEDGNEGAPAGYWMDHIFHQAHIGISAAEYGLIAGDIDFLREKGWPVIRAVVAYYLQGWLYRDADNRLYIGKCTDLERLGTFQERGLMTTCAVIRLLRLGRQVSRLLNVSAQRINEWETIADELEKSIPTDGVKYLPCPNADQRCIAIYMATAMYGVLDPNNELTRNALDDADAHQSDFAHQYYSGGKVMSSWYAGLMAQVAVHNGDFAKAIRLLEDAAQATGAFGECFEVYEASLRPWFSTASGAVVSAINTLLRSSTQPGSTLPNIWKKFSCHIAGKDGGKTRISCENGAVNKE